MATRNPTLVRGLQWVALVIAVVRSVLTIIDLASGTTGVSLWTGLVCWPIVAVCSVIYLVKHPKD